MKRFSAIILAMCFAGYLKAQDEAEKPNVKINGYVKTETIFDTYRSVDSRDGEVYLYPLRRNLDPSGKDINQVPQLEILGLQSRFRITAAGGTVWGAKTSAFIESDFVGTSQDYKFMLRLRHAAIKFDWPKTQLLFGQYWHAVRLENFEPGVLIFAGGSGFNPSIRAPQIRVSHYVTPTLRLIGVVCTYAYHRPIEPSGNNSQRNSGLPDLQFQVQYGNPKQFFAAVTAGYKFLKPYLTTWSPIDSSTYKSTKVVGSYNLQGCIEYNFPFLSIKLQGNLGENLTGYTMIGGYGPVEGSMNSKGEYDYANMTSGTLWADLETKGEKVKLGLFGGVAKNLGTGDKNITFINANGVNTKKDLCRDADLQQVFRVSPRVKINSGNVSFGFEYILTGAVYGTYNGNRITATEKPTYDSRFLAMVQYTF